MKKLFAFVLSAVIVCCQITTFAKNREYRLNIDSDKIVSIYFSVYGGGPSPVEVPESSVHFNYTVEEENEIKYICNILNSFVFIDDNDNTFASDELEYTIRLMSSDGETRNLYYHDNAKNFEEDKLYSIGYAYFELLAKYIYSLKEEKNDYRLNLNSGTITSIDFSAVNENRQMSQYNFRYTATDENEIANICNMLNTYTFTDGESTDENKNTTIYHICITDNNGEKKELYFDGILNYNEKKYGVKSADFDPLREYIYVLNLVKNGEYRPDFNSNEIDLILFSAGGGPITTWQEESNFSYSVTEKDTQHFMYISSKKNEMEYICHALNSFRFKKTENRDFEYTPKYKMCITDIFGKEIVWSFDSQSLLYNGEFFEVDNAEFSTLVNCLYGLDTGKLVLADDVIAMPSSWAEADINTAAEEGLLPELHRINYNGNISRLEVCQLLNNLLTVKEIEQAVNLYDYPFKDISDIAVGNLYQLKVINGKSETEFYPYDSITREELAKILSNSMDILGLNRDFSAHVYSDLNDISDWAVDDVNAMYNSGIMFGKSDDKFNPKDTLTKEEMIVSLLRLSKMIKQE
ncbi:MAG: S-layer homology domain-containing protein [Oscillospiraceae bacterium]|nr:S-layer homology domain-containing protein [Oscillospiraceae bacterium]